MLKKTAIVVLLALVILTAFGESMAQVHTSPPDTVRPQQENTWMLASANDAFALDLYHVLRENNDGNLVFSPYSISSAVGMLYAGAGGNTQSQIAATFHFDGDPAEISAQFGALYETIQPNEVLWDEYVPTEMQIANGLWLANDYIVMPDYITQVERDFGAGIRTLDIAADPEAARQVINDWVSDKTYDRVQDLVPYGVIHDETKLILANAIYFKAGWDYVFVTEHTADGPFTLLDGSEVTVPMMQSYNFDARYAEGDGYQVVRMPFMDYGQMLIVIPDAGQFEAVEARLGMGEGQINPFFVPGEYVYIRKYVFPRFEFSTGTDLSDILPDMGMIDAFSDEADFSAISPEGLILEKALHQAFINVTEKGTEAAGATVVMGRGGGGGPVTVIPEFKVDRPFIFAIYDERTGALFMGRVLNPAE